MGEEGKEKEAVKGSIGGAMGQEGCRGDIHIKESFVEEVTSKLSLEE